jgi:hypothetical protein
MSAKGNESHRKQRGFWLSFWLIIFILFELLWFFLIIDYRQQTPTNTLPWYISLLLLATIAKVVGLAGVWFWERWGVQVYAVAVIVSIVVGLIMTANWIISFNEVIPLVILGWLIRDKWEYFGEAA